MDFELKNFEDKINDITEQFMSLLDSNKGIEDRITTRFDNMTSDGIFKFEDTVGTATTNSSIPSHAIRFDEAADLNKRLEELYNTKRYDSAQEIKAPQLAFADYGLGGYNTNVTTNTTGNDTNDKIYSANEKEGNNMANYEYNAEGDNSIFSFATIPQERALAPQRSFSDVLFMDIPWDTKVDIWGGIKSFLNAEVKFTF